MKINILIAATFCLLGISCSVSKSANNTPKCISDKIEIFDKKEDCAYGVQVVKYSFQNETVFVFEPGNCVSDNTSEVIDSQCKSLGFLGGFVGNHTINGADFSTAQILDTIWVRK